MEEDIKDKKAYEISLLAKEEAAFNQLATLIKQHGGEIALEPQVKRINLAYEIKKENSAHFGFLHFLMNPEEAHLLGKELQNNPVILRFLLITPPFTKAKPSSRPSKAPRAPVSKPFPESVSNHQSLPLSNEALEKKIEEILN